MEIWMDHHNLEYFITAKKLNHRQAWWFLYLVRFDFVLHHCPNKSMKKPDVLSHQWNYGDELHNNENVVLFKLDILAVQIIKEIVFESEEWTLLMDIQKGNRFGHHEESVARVTRELQ